MVLLYASILGRAKEQRAVVGEFLFTHIAMRCDRHGGYLFKRFARDLAAERTQSTIRLIDLLRRLRRAAVPVRLVLEFRHAFSRDGIRDDDRWLRERCTCRTDGAVDISEIMSVHLLH